MNKLWKFLQERINKAEKAKKEIPFLHEAINFKEYPHSGFLEWKNDRHHQLMKQRLQQAYFNYATGGDAMDAAFEFLHSPISNGFVLFHRQTYRLDTWDYRFFQHDISLKLKELNYIINLADVKSGAKANGVETIYRYYLKPSSRLRQAPKAQQLYGNISIEVILRDDVPYMVRCIANSYQDQNFHPPKPFGELISLIVS